MITIIASAVGIIVAAVGLAANAAQIHDWVTKTFGGRRQKSPVFLPPPKKKAPRLVFSNAKKLNPYRKVLDVLRWENLADSIAAKGVGGVVITVQAPFGGVRKLLTDAAVASLSIQRGQTVVVRTERELIEHMANASRALLITELPSAIEAQRWLQVISDTRQGLSRRRLKKARDKIILILMPPGRDLVAPSLVELADVLYEKGFSQNSVDLRSTLVGSDDPVRFERDCQSWSAIHEDGIVPSSAGLPASVTGRFLVTWALEIDRALVDADPNTAIAFFLATVSIGVPITPTSILRAIEDPPLKVLFERFRQSLFIARESGGLVRIACRIAVRRVFELLRFAPSETRERILRATALGCGDLPPWVRLLCIEAEAQTFDEVARADLAAMVEAILQVDAKSSPRNDFLGTNTLLLNAIGKRHQIRHLRAAPLLWPSFDQRSYRRFIFDGCRILVPTLPDSFGPVSALCWIQHGLLAFGTFTGELRLVHVGTRCTTYAGRIDQNAISGIALSADCRELIAVSYSGAIHRLDLDRLSRVGTPILTGSRIRGVVSADSTDFILLVNEAGELVRFDPTTSMRRVIWRTADGTRLKSITMAGEGVACLGMDTGEVALIDIIHGSALKQTIASAPIRSLAFSRKSKLIAAVSDDGALYVLTSAGHLNQKIPVCEEKLWSVAFLDESREIVVGGNAGMLRFFDAATFLERRSVHVHGSWIRCILPDPVGRTIWTGGEDQTLCEFDTHSMLLNSRRSGAAPRIFTIRQFRSDSYLVGAGDGALYCVDVGDLSRIRWIGAGHEDQIWCVDVSADLDLVLTGSDDRKLGVWRLSNGAQVAYLECGQGWIGAVSMHAPTRSALAGDDNGYLYQFDTISFHRISVTRISARRISSIIETKLGFHLASTEAGEIVAFKVKSTGIEMLWTRILGSKPLFSLMEMEGGKIIAGAGDGMVTYFHARPRSRAIRRQVAAGPIWSLSSAPKSTEFDAIFCSDAGEIGFVGEEKERIIYKRSAPIWTCTATASGRSVVFGGEDGELLELEFLANRICTYPLPRVFSGASFREVSGLMAQERSLMAAAGAIFN